GAGNLARRRQRQRRTLGTSRRARLLRRPEQSQQRARHLHQAHQRRQSRPADRATNMIAPAMPVIMQAGKMTIGMLGVNVNRQFNYSRYFSMVPGGDEGTLAFSRGWFEIAAAQTPKPKTVALIAADAEFGKTACDGARENAKAGGFEIVYDKSYPPGTTD